MKSLWHKGPGGNFNLKGKREVLCTCGCCSMVNPKYKIRQKEDQKEVRLALRGG